MAVQFRKAERKKAKLRLGIAGPSGAGKTYSALLIAFGLGGKVAFIDTENGSGDLYAHLGDYDILQIEAPFTAEKYIDAIQAAEGAGYDTIIIDSLSHVWAGEGGLLDQQGKIADSGKGNGFAAWRSITPKHNALVEAMLQSKCHVIATMRSKTEYVQQTSNGKTEIKKVGLAPVQRDGMEYEFTVMLDISADHIASASKDRTGMVDGQFTKPDQKLGKKFLEWLESGVDPLVAAKSELERAAKTTAPDVEEAGRRAAINTIAAKLFDVASVDDCNAQQVTAVISSIKKFPDRFVELASPGQEATA